MKIYSEVLKKFYDDVESCEAAEAEYKRKQDEAEAAKKAEANVVSAEKKEMANAIQAADDRLNAAYEKFDVAKAEAKKMIDEVEAKADEMLLPIKEEIKAAQKEKYDAVSAFNRKFGAYTQRFTGEHAYKELKRAYDWVDSWFNNLFL